MTTTPLLYPPTTPNTSLVVPTTTIASKASSLVTVSGEPLRDKITKFTNALRPKIAHFLTNPCFLFWHPPQLADTTQQFYNAVKNSLFNEIPGILLHNLGVISDSYPDPIFKGDMHQYALSALGIDVVNGY